MWFGAVGRVCFSVLLISLFILDVKGNDFAFTPLTHSVKCGREKPISSEEYDILALKGCENLKHEEDNPNQCSHHSGCFYNRRKNVNFPKPYVDGRFRNKGENLYLIKIPPKKNFKELRTM
ncbi:hypothetical protein GcM1_151011 [Golovinomyces cichoracearum]|uniref:Secreted effector protein n=1 Tax=Golovinomyces cichoracearum TaxID=62708 RepID=A0A420JAT4_9PEZI|nr:hypothetical protein GcM1_151011 [Golovinomyces cichoracearum]